MTKEDFRSFRQVLGLKTTPLAKLLDVDPKTIRRYAAGEPIPVVVSLFMEAAGTWPSVLKLAQRRAAEREKARDAVVSEVLGTPRKRRRIL